MLNCAIPEIIAMIGSPLLQTIVRKKQAEVELVCYGMDKCSARLYHTMYSSIIAVKLKFLITT